jgi:cyclopropane fatty-acyl-phospholipid synthase-like methyltransferase
VGLDFVPETIERARAGARSDRTKARFVTGDVARLRALGVAGPFDLILDIDCYHAIPDRLRDEYAAEVAAASRPDADFYLAGITHPPAPWRLLGASGVDAAELRLRFGNAFDVADERSAGSIGRMRKLNLYHLVRN